jgi:hypothetical protein
MKPFFALLWAFSALSSAWAYDWPAPDMQVIRTFGQKTQGAVLPGVEVQTLSPVLAAPENGDVLFVFQPASQEVQNLPSSLGGFIALSHDDNLRTVTTRIDPAVDANKRSYRRGEPLGPTEVQPGVSESRHRLFVFDQQLGELVNPLLVYPQVTDGKAPLFYDVRAYPEGGLGTSVSLFGQGTLAVGYWTIHVVVSDPVTLVPAAGKERGVEGQRGVYGIEAYLNGGEVFNTNLDSIQEKAGRWQIKGMQAFLDDVLVQDQEWNLGQVFINQGTNILEVVIKDFKGNQTGKTFRVLGTR